MPFPHIQAKIAVDAGVEISFFHGKGGTVGRGGNPQTFLAILAHAPDTINGQFCVTKQGEMITQNFGYADRAERTMDIYKKTGRRRRMMIGNKERKLWKSNWPSKLEHCDSWRI
jgi:phosphoenolpyruvate carboxylase